MTSFLIGLFLGAFVGWNLPQPKWAKDLQTKVVEKVKKGL